MYVKFYGSLMCTIYYDLNENLERCVMFCYYKVPIYITGISVLYEMVDGGPEYLSWLMIKYYMFRLASLYHIRTLGTAYTHRYLLIYLLKARY